MFNPMSCSPCSVICLLSVLLLAVVASDSRGQLDFEQAPIHYQTAPLHDRITRLQSALERNEDSLTWDEKHGWLPSLLQKLTVSAESQTLVFTKTSLQLRKISPRQPRAIYFSDDVYVGAVRGGELELSAVDPNLGAVFFTLAQEPGHPRIQRSRGECMACHATARTKGVPGYLVRSVFPLADGQPELRLGTTTTDHTTPFEDRFGGWYVTGQHGVMRHRGNAMVDEQALKLDHAAGANVADLSPYFRVEDYLTPHSDIVALMVLEHQSQLHNLITKAGYTTRKALHQNAAMNEILERPDGYISDSTRRRYQSAAEKLLAYLLLSNEFPLGDAIQGSSQFARVFQQLGPRDRQGRSLRDLDLQTRMFRYPCSFLIYSDSFAALPMLVRERVEHRLAEVLSGRDETDKFAHLSVEDRKAIREILADTLPASRAERFRSL